MTDFVAQAILADVKAKFLNRSRSGFTKGFQAKKYTKSKERKGKDKEKDLWFIGWNFKR